MRPPFQLAGEHPSTDTIEVLKDLLEMATKGQVIGLAFTVLLKRRQIQVGTTGEASRSPVFAVGAVRVLEQSILQHMSQP